MTKNKSSDFDTSNKQSLTSDNCNETSISSTQQNENENENQNEKLSKQQLKLSNVIIDQFNLEILLKHRELLEINKNLKKVKRLISNIQSFTNSKNNGTLQTQTQTQTHNVVHFKDIDYSRSRTRSSTSQIKPPKSKYSNSNTVICITRRKDGVLVKLTCLNCNRSNFINTQGFINHCRFAHGKEYLTHIEAINNCASIIEDQDEIGMKALKYLNDVTNNENKRKLDEINDSTNITKRIKKEEDLNVPLEGAIKEARKLNINVDELIQNSATAKPYESKIKKSKNKTKIKTKIKNKSKINININTNTHTNTRKKNKSNINTLDTKIKKIDSDNDNEFEQIPRVLPSVKQVNNLDCSIEIKQLQKININIDDNSKTKFYYLRSVSMN